MAYSFQVPRMKTINSQAKTLNTGDNLYDLQRQAPVSEGQQLAEQQNTQGLKTGQWADVQSAQNATNRQNALRTSSALQATRGTFARSGVDTSPEAAARAQDQSFSAAEGQNLNGTNAVNQLQRQYRNDAMAQAGKNEQGYTDRQNATTNTLGTLGNLDIANKNADINQQNADTTRYSAEGDVGYKGGQLALDTTKEEHSFALGTREADTADKNAAANALEVENRAKAEAARLGFDYDKLSQEDKNQLLDREQKKHEFSITSGQTDRSLNQKDKEIENQAKQEAARLGFDYDKLSQEDRQFLIDNSRKNAEFDVTSKIDQQNADTSAQGVANNYALGSGELQLGYDELGSDQNVFRLERGDLAKKQTWSEIQAMPEGPSKNQAITAYYSGGDVGKTISGGINADGSLKNPGMSPGEATVQSKVDAIKAYTPKLVGESDDAYNARINTKVQEYFTNQDTISKGVQDTGVKSVAVSQAKDILATNPKLLTDTQKTALVASGDIPSYKTASAVPIGDQANQIKGKTVEFGGKYYTMNGGGSVITEWNGAGSSNTHKDYATLMDGDTPVYVVDGKLTSTKPVDKSKPKAIGAALNYIGF
jgi:hypothetical protein